MHIYAATYLDTEAQEQPQEPAQEASPAAEEPASAQEEPATDGGNSTESAPEAQGGDATAEGGDATAGGEEAPPAEGGAETSTHVMPHLAQKRRPAAKIVKSSKKAQVWRRVACARGLRGIMLLA